MMFTCILTPSTLHVTFGLFSGPLSPPGGGFVRLPSRKVVSCGGSYLNSGTESSRRQGSEEQWEALLCRMSSLAVNGGEDVGSGLSGELAGMTLTDRQHGGDRQETAMETDMPVDDGRGEYGDRLAVRMTGLTLTDSPGRTVKTGRRGVTANLATLRTDAWSFWQQKDRHGSGGGERTKRKRDNPVQICKDNKGVGREGVRQKDSPDWQKRSLAIQRTKLTRTLSPAKLLGAKKLSDTKRGQSGRQDYLNTFTNPNAPSGLVNYLKKKFQGGKDKTTYGGGLGQQRTKPDQD
jgi:hypothetical protein